MTYKITAKNSSVFRLDLLFILVWLDSQSHVTTSLLTGNFYFINLLFFYLVKLSFDVHFSNRYNKENIHAKKISFRHLNY